MSFVPTVPTTLNPWVRILGALEKKINRQSFETWLKPTRFSHISGKKLFVRIPTPEFQHVGDRYGDLIQEAIDTSNWNSTRLRSLRRKKIRRWFACAKTAASRLYRRMRPRLRRTAREMALGVAPPGPEWVGRNRAVLTGPQQRS